jgi:Family of unknown function (DUF6582)
MTPKSPEQSTAEKSRLFDEESAFPKQHRGPLSDARHVRNALARFDQVEGVSDRGLDPAWARIVQAAQRVDVEVTAQSWRDLGDKARRS